MVILPALSTSTRAIPTPAAATARMIRVTSCCRNVEGARAIGILLESVRAALAAIMRGLAVNYLVSNYSNAIWRLRPAGAFRYGRVGMRPLPPARLLQVPGLFHLVEQVVDRVPIAPIGGCHDL